MTSLTFPLNLSQQHIDAVVSESSDLLNLMGLRFEHAQGDPLNQGIATFQPVREAEKVKAFLRECTCGWQ